MTMSAVLDTARTEKRRRAILAAASSAFLEDGFSATSMSSIANRVGGSKGTLYTYFRSKEALFAAFMADACGAAADALFEHLPPMENDLHGELVKLGVTFLHFHLSDPVIAIHRLVVAEAARFPALGNLFYENGPLKGERRLAEYMAEAMDAGHLRAADPIAAARHFRDLSLSDLYARRLWGVAAQLTDEDAQAAATRGVEVFLAFYGR